MCLSACQIMKNGKYDTLKYLDLKFLEMFLSKFDENWREWVVIMTPNIDRMIHSSNVLIARMAVNGP